MNPPSAMSDLAADGTRIGRRTPVRVQAAPERLREVGQPATDRFTLRNANGLSLTAISRGASITELLVPDRAGTLADIVLGLDADAAYEQNEPYFGCVVGRCANRIAGGRFTLDGLEYQLPINNDANHLHGGRDGFDARTWKGEAFETSTGEGVQFRLMSDDGDQGYPGRLMAQATYLLTERNELVIEFEASTSAPTLVNLAQHTYWNLAGHDAGSVEDHVLQLHANRFTPVCPDSIPTGQIAAVDGTPFDFTRGKPIGRDFAAVGVEPRGYDHNWVIEGEPGIVRPVARVVEPTSGRVLELASDQPGVQFYTARFLDGSIRGKGGVAYDRSAGLCLETQAFPDAINQTERRAGWVAPILRPGQIYRHVMVIRFSTDRETSV
ncbi:MAG: aldose epimerase family protein [Planctomycetota bacterium]